MRPARRGGEATVRTPSTTSPMSEPTLAALLPSSALRPRKTTIKMLIEKPIRGSTTIMMAASCQ